MKVAAVTVNFNNPSDTEACLESFSSYAPETKVVIVDNASAKGDVSIVSEKFDNVIKLIVAETNLGFGRGNNLAVRWALENTDCEYILFINNDARVDESTVGLLTAYLDENRHISGVAPRIVISETPDILWYGGGELKWKMGGARSWDFHGRFSGDTEPKEVSFVSACALLLRRSVLERTGGFDPRYFMYYEDVELCARIISDGGRFVYLPEAVVYHRTHGSIREDGEGYTDAEHYTNPKLCFFLENSVCNNLLTHFTYAPPVDKLIGVAYLAARWSWDSLNYIVRGRPDAAAAIVRGKRANLKLRNVEYVNELKD